MNSFKLLQLNIFCRPKFVKTHGRDFRTFRLNELLKISPNYDVICLQEYFECKSNRKMLDNFMQRLELQGFTYHITGPWQGRCGAFMSGGLLIASKYPIVDYEAVPYKDHGYASDSLTKKGFLYAKIQFPTKAVQIITTHLQANYNTEKEQPRHQKSTSNQLNQLSAFIQSTLNHDLPIILAGDFNIDALLDEFETPGSPPESLRRVVEYYDSDLGRFKGTIRHQNMPAIGNRVHCTQNYTNMIQILNCLEKTYKPQFDIPEQQSSGEHLDYKLVDLPLEYYDGHPVTFGDIYVINGKIEAREKHLTGDKCQCSCQRLDYIFTYQNKGFEYIEARVLSGFVRGSTKQLSDHYGHEVEFVL
ncbi:Neutral_sphingomyelinase [Hexamita inflata]|uniref:sphingomyelin phosphodiesterase n=1 Tax=Hexamita inflata TaxID=28002 RepID=A0AA86UH61_9EUKA|nr:Neutral sphingomyelinase [Hexamita inflata]